MSRARRAKTLKPEEVKGERLVIDGFNVLSVVLSALEGRVLLLGTDGFVRDIAALTRKIKVSPLLLNSLVLVLLTLVRLSPAESTFYYDAQVSRSALAAVTTREVMARLGLKGRAELVSKADKASVSVTDAVVCSADSVILDLGARLFDLGGLVASMISPEGIIDIGALIECAQSGCWWP